MLDKIREALRITHHRLDVELQDMIHACRADLYITGIVKYNENDPLIQQAIKIYVKLQYEQDVNKANRLSEAYNSLKIAMSLCGEYANEK